VLCSSVSAFKAGTNRVACMPRCRVEEWRFAASIRVYRAVFVKAALKAVTFCWQKGVSSLIHIWQTYMGGGGGCGGGLFWSVSVIRPVAPRQYSSLQLTIIWIHTDWSQFLCYSRVGKVRQWVQARNSPLCGDIVSFINSVYAVRKFQSKCKLGARGTSQ
jgi:hypothetical protein